MGDTNTVRHPLIIFLHYFRVWFWARDWTSHASPSRTMGLRTPLFLIFVVFHRYQLWWADKNKVVNRLDSISLSISWRPYSWTYRITDPGTLLFRNYNLWTIWRRNGRG